jgi:hypothetical protein
MKVNAHRDCKYKMRKRKEGWEETNSWHVIYLMVSVGTKPPLIHGVEALHTRVLLTGHQVPPKSTTWLATKARHEGPRQAHLITLMSAPLGSFSTKGGDLHASRTKYSPLHTKMEGQRLAGEPLRSQGFCCTLCNLIDSRITITSQGWHTLHTTQV